MPNPFVHMELNASDVTQAKNFYHEMFGWEFVEADLGSGATYSTFRTQAGVTGGIYASPDSPRTWLPYVGVEDIHQATKTAVARGATVLRGPQEIPSIGWLTIMSDPGGATIAIWQDINGLNV